jgi:hypothetical protein
VDAVQSGESVLDADDSLSTLEAEADQLGDEPAMPEDIDTQAVPVTPQAEVVSSTVRQFVERLKQEEIRKRQQAAANGVTESTDLPDEPMMPSNDDHDHHDDEVYEPISVAQLAYGTQPQHDVHAQIVGPRPQVQQPQPVTAQATPQPQPKPAQPKMRPVAQPVESEPEHLHEPQVVHHHEPQVQSHGTPHLASYLSDAGVISLSARCPQHPEVDIALDENGGLHLLARHQQHVGDSSVRDAMYQLLDARGWVDQHISLLSLTQKQLRFDMQIRPVVHLFTDDARGAAQLVAHSAKFVKLHLLSEVTVGSSSAFYCTELN